MPLIALALPDAKIIPGGWGKPELLPLLFISFNLFYPLDWKFCYPTLNRFNHFLRKREGLDTESISITIYRLWKVFQAVPPQVLIEETTACSTRNLGKT